MSVLEEHFACLVASVLVLLAPGHAWSAEPSSRVEPSNTSQPSRPKAPDVPTEHGKEAPFLRVYGFIKPTVIAASGAVDSYGRSNMSAITSAGNPALAVQPGESRLTFQVQQSRFGFWLREQEPLRGQLEFDLIDPSFSKSSPTTATYPRLRIARIEYAFDARHKVAFGQDWDVFSPLSPFTFNIVGSLYQSGNAGFFRQQLSYSYTGEHLEAAVALGFSAANNGAQDRGLELAKVPSLAVRLGALLGKLGRVGISAIGTQLDLKPGEALERRTLAYGANFYGELAPYDGLQLRAEAYVGQNLGNINLLTIAYGRGPATAGDAVANVREAGFWLSAKHKIVKPLSAFATVGSAHVLNPSLVVPNYTPAVPATATSPAVAAALGPDPLGGLRRNTSARIGVEWKPMPALALVAEGYFLSTLHRLHPDDASRYGSRHEVYGSEIGAMYTF